MDRLKEKLTQAAGVNLRVADAIEKDVDILIAREQVILDRKNAAFKAHHMVLDERMKELDGFEDNLQILENAIPLPDTGATGLSSTLEKAVADAVTEPPASQTPGS